MTYIEDYQALGLIKLLVKITKYQSRKYQLLLDENKILRRKLEVFTLELLNERRKSKTSKGRRK